MKDMRRHGKGNLNCQKRKCEEESQDINKNPKLKLERIQGAKVGMKLEAYRGVNANLTSIFFFFCNVYLS